MTNYNRIISQILVASLVLCSVESPVCAEVYKSITYHTGYPGVQKATGQLEVTNDMMLFYSGTRPREGSSSWGKSAFTVRLSSITNVDWNEDAKRMVGPAVATTLLLGPLGLLFLLGKKKSDYIKVQYQDPAAGRAGELLFQGQTGIGASIKAMLDMKSGLSSRRSDTVLLSDTAVAATSPIGTPSRHAFCERGYERLGAGDAEGALKEFKKASLVNNRDTDVFLGMATAHEILGNRESALSNIRRVLELDPQNSQANELLEAMVPAEPDPTIAAEKP